MSIQIDLSRLHSEANAPFGFAMVEVLITVTVMSIGLLGLATLQVNSLNSNFRAEQRTEALLLANDLVERMRGNFLAAREGRYEANGPPPNAPANCDDFCDRNALARYDLAQWYARITAQLRSGGGTVDCVDNPCVAGSRYDIRIFWDENRDGVIKTEPGAGETPEDPSIDPVIKISLVP